MATTVDLACTACAWVDKDNPTTNYHGAASYELQGSNDGLLFLTFETLAQQYWGYKVDSVTLYFTVNESLQSSSSIFFYGASEGFSESAVTYDTKPEYARFYGLKIISSGSGDATFSFNVTDNGSKPENIHFSLRDPALYFQSGTISQTGDYLRVYTNYANSGKRPFLRVVVSDTLLLPKAAQDYPQSGADEKSTVLADQSVTVSWLLDSSRTGEYGYGPVQSSAVFRWSTTNEAPWNEYEISGSNQFITFPANTFPAHGSIFWRVSITCYGGKTTLTSGYFHARLLVELPLLGGANVTSLSPDVNRTWEFTIASSTTPTLQKQETVDLFSFGDVPAAYAYNVIFSAGLYFEVYYSTDSSYTVIGGDIYKLKSSFVPDRVTWNTKPETEGKIAGWTLRTDGTVPNNSLMQLPDYSDSTNPVFYKEDSATAAKFAKAKYIRLDGPQNSFTSSVYKTIVPGAPMTLRLWFHDTIITSKPQAAKYDSGYVNRHVAQIFEWDLVPDSDYSCFGSWAQVSAIFSYRAGTSGTWTEVPISGSTQSIEISANTLPAGTVQWKIQTTDDQGTTATSDTYTITTTDTLHTATPVYPNSSLENGDAPIRFIWTDASDTNTAPTGADLQYSTNGSSWTTFAQPQTSATETDAPASTFPAGTVLWRVRSLNADGVAGAWSDPISFICFAAPDAPIISTNGKPMLTVTWQSGNQQAYKVIVDGKAYGPYFGTSKSFTVPDFLSDGTHTVAVSVQNEYSLWSLIDPETDAGIVSVIVTNVPGEPVTLTGFFDRDAALRWTCEDATADFLIYRDGVQIGHSSGYSFTDRTVLDFHTWRVINRLPGGYYTASNTVSGTLCTEGLALALLAGGPWIDLTLSENPIRTTTAAAGRSVVLRQFAGREYPDAEAAPYKTLQISFDVSWTPAQADQARAFEALIGEAVIFKEPGEEAFVGVLSAFQRSHSFPARSYSATVQRIHWREYVDADS